MKTFKEFYKEIENPILNDSCWDMIIERYVKSHDETQFLKQISSCSKKEESKIDENDKEVFYAYSFNAWKKRITSLEKEVINDMISKGIVEEDFKELPHLLKDANSVRSTEEMKLLLAKPIIMKYFSLYLNGENERVFVNTRLDKKELESLRYAFIINVEEKHLYLFLRELIKECLISEADYTFHFTEKRTDAAITVYTSDANFDLYSDILNRVGKENRIIIPQTLKPSPLMGVVKDWIGVGSASVYDEEEYLESRAKLILDAFDQTMYDYIALNMEMLVSYKAQRLTIREYLCMFVANYQVEVLISKEKKEEVIRTYHISYQEVENLKAYIKSMLLKEFEQIFTTQIVDAKKTVVSIPLKNGKELQISIDDFRYAIRKLFLILLFKDKTLLDEVKDRVHNECNYYDIDPEKFCFDKDTYEIMHYDFKDNDIVKEKVDEMKKVATMLGEVENLQTNSKEFTDDIRNKIASNLKAVHKIFEDNLKDK